MKPLLLGLCTLIGAFSQLSTYNNCRPSDIKSIIGGDDYTVDEIRGINFFHAGREQLLVFGQLTTSDKKSKGFFFLYDYLFCSSVEIREAKEINQGIHDAFYFENQLFLLVYRSDHAKVQGDLIYEEIITVLDLQAELTGEKFLQLKQKGYSYVINYDLLQFKAIKNGFFAIPSQQGPKPNIIVVYPNEVRFYRFVSTYISQDSRTQKDGDHDRNIAVAYRKQNGVWDSVIFLKAISTGLKLINLYFSERQTYNQKFLDGPPIIRNILTQDSSKDGAVIFFQPEGHVLEDTYVALNMSKFTILWFFLYKPVQYEFNMKLKVFHISISSEKKNPTIRS